MFAVSEPSQEQLETFIKWDCLNQCKDGGHVPCKVACDWLNESGEQVATALLAAWRENAKLLRFKTEFQRLDDMLTESERDRTNLITANAVLQGKVNEQKTSRWHPSTIFGAPFYECMDVIFDRRIILLRLSVENAVDEEYLKSSDAITYLKMHMMAELKAGYQRISHSILRDSDSAVGVAGGGGNVCSITGDTLSSESEKSGA